MQYTKLNKRIVLKRFMFVFVFCFFKKKGVRGEENYFSLHNQKRSGFSNVNNPFLKEKKQTQNTELPSSISLTKLSRYRGFAAL